VEFDGVAIAGYRSFGDQPQYIGPLAKVNLLAGANNSGKSNVLRFVHKLLPQLIADGSSTRGVFLDDLDRHRPTAPAFRFAIATDIHSDYHNRLRDLLGTNDQAKQALDKIVTATANEDGLVWWPYSAGPNGTALDGVRLMGSVDKDQLVEPLSQLGVAVSNLASNNRVDAFVKAILEWFDRNRPTLPPVVFVPAVRQIGVSAPTDESELTGDDLIQRLAALQNPSIREQHKKRQFRAVNEFVQAVTGDPKAEIEIPGDRDTIHVHLGESVLPLENLGSGIHEVTMLAAWSSVFEDHVVCLEEPEIHLHPLLQRKLIRHISDKTTNRYLISTHSAHFLDQPNASVFHVRWDGSQTEVSRAVAPSQRVDLCADLGYRASDILQSNAIVWVEGPSDRLYIRHWLTAVDPELVEGVHYSLMFYGGRLLSHLSANDVEIEDFISLRKINQWLVIVIDSDRSSSGKRLNATKQRVRAEFDRGPGFAWITKGREIENYVSDKLLSAAISRVHPSSKPQADLDDRQYADVTKVNVRGKPIPVDKVKVAHHVVTREPDLSILDLAAQVRRLATFIRTANGLSPGR